MIYFSVINCSVIKGYYMALHAHLSKDDFRNFSVMDIVSFIGVLVDRSFTFGISLDFIMGCCLSHCIEEIRKRFNFEDLVSFVISIVVSKENLLHSGNFVVILISYVVPSYYVFTLDWHLVIVIYDSLLNVVSIVDHDDFPIIIRYFISKLQMQNGLFRFIEVSMVINIDYSAILFGFSYKRDFNRNSPIGLCQEVSLIST